MNHNKRLETISEHIFRAYDIRGIYGEDLDADVAERVGRGFGTFIGSGKDLAVGRDVRLSGEELKDSVTKGLAFVGCHVVDLGIVTTPILYFTIAHKKMDGGVMVTASHNPPEWNGFKLCTEGGMICAQGFGMEEVKEKTMKENFTQARIMGTVKPYEGILEEYSSFVLSKISVARKLRVILDTGNGASGIVAPKLFRQVGCEITVLNEKLDGNFPSHPPEPKGETLKQLIREVERSGADFGVGYDGDGDRAVFVDNTGRMLTGDICSIVFVNALRGNKNTKVVYDVSCSRSVEEAIRAKGAIPIVEKVGRPFMMARVLRENAAFGGERSGHFYFPEIYGLDDGTFASLRMAEILSKSDKEFSEMVDEIPKYPSATINFHCPDERKFQVIKQLKKQFDRLGFKILELDGLKAYSELGWALMRPSNTEPLIRIFAEAETERKLNQLLHLAKQTLEREVERLS